MTTTNTSRAAKALAVLSVTAALSTSLAACGDETKPGGGKASPAEQAAVYDFESAKAQTDDAVTPWETDSESYTIKLSDELKAAIPADRAVAVEKYTVTQKAFDTGICRVDVAIDYADGGLEAVKTIGPDDVHVDDVTQAVMNKLTLSTYSAKRVDTAPSDDDIDLSGQYLTNDYSTMTFVDDCSTSAGHQDNEFIVLDFPYIDSSDPKRGSSFAGTRIFVTNGGGTDNPDGVTSIIYGGSSADVSANGKWKTDPSD